MREMRDSSVDPTDESMTKELRAGTWFVYVQYRRPRTSGGERYIVAPPYVDLHEKNERWEYWPLVKHSDGQLFLEFARLAKDGDLDADPLDTDNNANKALDWAEKHGVLGLTPAKGREAWWGDPRGGAEDTVAAFASEAWAANKTLKLYEAAWRPGGADVKTIASLAPPDERKYIRSRDAAKDWALGQAARHIQYRVARYAYPQLYQRKKTNTFVEGYDFANLCGALWLQAFWLLTTDDVRKCGWCNSILYYEEPEKPLEHKKGERKKPKTYKNKRFCNNTCVQANRRAKLSS